MNNFCLFFYKHCRTLLVFIYAIHSRFRVHAALAAVAEGLLNFPNSNSVEASLLNLTKLVNRLDKYIYFCQLLPLSKRNKFLISGYKKWCNLTKFSILNIVGEQVPTSVIISEKRPDSIPDIIAGILHHFTQFRILIKKMNIKTIEEKEHVFSLYVDKTQEIKDFINKFSQIDPYWARMFYSMLSFEMAYVASKIYPETFWTRFLFEISDREIKKTIYKKIKNQNALLLTAYEDYFLIKARQILAE